MGKMKEIDRLVEEVANAMSINPEDVNLSQTTGGWLADVYISGHSLKSEILPEPIDAMKSLLAKANADS